MKRNAWIRAKKMWTEALAAPKECWGKKAAPGWNENRKVATKAEIKKLVASSCSTSITVRHRHPQQQHNGHCAKDFFIKWQESKKKISNLNCLNTFRDDDGVGVNAVGSFFCVQKKLYRLNIEPLFFGLAFALFQMRFSLNFTTRNNWFQHCTQCTQF